MTSRLSRRFADNRGAFLEAAAGAGATVTVHPVAGHVDIDGGVLDIAVARLGASAPDRVLVVLSGVHGVEGFAAGAMQEEMLRRGPAIGAGRGLVVVHGVNPWGMVHGRRQDADNVDLNRNWRRDGARPPANEAYAELHGLACPDTDELPSIDSLLATTKRMVAERGADWMVHAITDGQWTHDDGLHFGGHRTQPSNRVLEEAVLPTVASARAAVVLDLHTGHGRYGTCSLLVGARPDSPGHRLATSRFGHLDVTIEPSRRAGIAHDGGIARGLAAAAGDGLGITLEVGTANDIEQLIATHHEQWVHRRGDRSDPAHAAACRRYLECFSPDDAAWESAALEHGRAVLDAAVGWLNG